MLYKRFVFIVSGLFIIGLLITGQGSDSSVLASTPAAPQDIGTIRITPISNAYGRSPVFSADGQSVLFYQAADEDTVIRARFFEASMDTSQAPKLLFELAESVDNAVWSPDRTRLAYQAENKLFVVDKTGKPIFQRPASSSRFPMVWSADGSRLLVMAADQGLILLGADGKDQIKVTDWQPAYNDESMTFDLSPDGKRIVMNMEGDIYVINSDGSGETNLTRSEGRDETPKWSPDGKRIVFSSDASYGGNPLVADFSPYQLYSINADGTDLKRLTSDVSGVISDFCPVWSPDGHKIAFVRGNMPWSGGIMAVDSLFVLDVDTQKLSWLDRPNNLNVDCPQWSLQSDKLAFITVKDNYPPIENVYAAPLRALKSTVEASAIDYTVAFVPDQDTLNVRNGPGVEFAITDKLENGARVEVTGSGQITGKDRWVPIRYGEGKTGWVNRAFLAGDIDKMVFCLDPRPAQIVEAFREAVRAEDGQALARLLTPRGVYISLFWTGTLPVTVDQAVGMFKDGTQRTLPNLVRGEQVKLSLRDDVAPKLRRDLLPNTARTLCNNDQESSSTPYDRLNTSSFVRYDPLNFYTVFRPGKEGYELSWGGWGLVFDYWNGQPLISALVYYEREP